MPTPFLAAGRPLPPVLPGKGAGWDEEVDVTAPEADIGGDDEHSVRGGAGRRRARPADDVAGVGRQDLAGSDLMAVFIYVAVDVHHPHYVECAAGEHAGHAEAEAVAHHVASGRSAALSSPIPSIA
ncbi:hypothetical protein HPP92_019274 [Vanilla planifolia]|uniref:Uncharacterized protein n=1 Tax=Vanilla planifolia TaxID=51239 RepID=A0A835Q2K3_VANPL|nr:hypothetical protein HPP92_019274 [Vanilla planifolia]